MILGVTGHRPPILFGGYNNIDTNKYKLIKNAIASKILELSPEKIISGMAQGVDQIVVEIALDLEIPFIAAIPCDNQDAMWPQHAKNLFQDLLSKAESVFNVSPGPYTKSCMHDRDRWIVENSDALLAIWNGQRFGGTFATLRMAEKLRNKGRDYPIYTINPTKLES